MVRYWITDCNSILIREWTQNEYDNLDASTHIKEDVLWNICLDCGRPFSPVTHTLEDMSGKNASGYFCRECKRKQYNLIFKPKVRNNGYAYLKTELKCFECGEKEIDGKTVFYQRIY